MNRVGSLALIACVGLLAACSGSQTTKPSATGESVTASAGTTSAAGSADAGQASQLPGGARTANGDADLLAQRKIYFDFDSSEIKPAYAAMIGAHGKWLALDKSLHVRLEGNTDERGSPEYNVGLGERRAQAVKRALLLQGAHENQITTVSYGEERPVVEGHTEAAWSQNRRVDVVYLGDR